METIEFVKETPLGKLGIEISELKLGNDHHFDNVTLKINGNDFQLDFLFENGVKGLKIYKAETEKVFGKKLDKNVMLTLPGEIKKTLEGKFELMKAEKEAAKNLRIENLMHGKEKIIVRYQEGSPLSGWTIYDEEIEKLLKNLGLAKDVDGWGLLIDWQFIAKVGEKFTYSQALGYTRPEREKAETVKKTKEEKFNKALAQAKETGKPVVIGRYTDDCDNPDEECSVDTITEYIYPDGKIRTTRQHNW